MSTQNWDEGLLAKVAAEIRRLRKAQGMSAQKVADRTRELGHQVSRTTVADLENGRRKYITVAELLLLAAVLNTTPAALVYPGPYTGDVDVLPNTTAAEAAAAQWFGGNLPTPPPWSDSDAYRRNMENIASAFVARQQAVMKELEEVKREVADTQDSLNRWTERLERDLAELEARAVALKAQENPDDG